MKTTHLHNPWNENKPVKIGRDGQVNYIAPLIGNGYLTVSVRPFYLDLDRYMGESFQE